MFYGSGLMEMFLWSVGSFHVFGEKLDFVSKTLPNKSQSGFPTFQIDVQMQSSIISKVVEGFYFFEKGSHFSEKGVYFLEIAIVEIWWARSCK